MLSHSSKNVAKLVNQIISKCVARSATKISGNMAKIKSDNNIRRFMEIYLNNSNNKAPSSQRKPRK